YALYVNGGEVKRLQRQAGMAGIGTDGIKESVAAPVIAGEGVPGLIDEVRIHGNVNKFWPKPEQPWIAERAKAALPQYAAVLASGHMPVLYAPFEDNLSIPLNAKGVKLDGKGGLAYVDGIRGKAVRGSFNVSGALAGAEDGAVEFWFRPVAVNNRSDQNLTLFSNSLFNLYLFNTTSDFRPLTLYYYDPEKKIHFAGDTRGTDVYPDKWYHCLITWGSGKVEWYLDGEKSGGSDAKFAGKTLSAMSFNLYRLFGDIDELYVYDKALSQVEAANSYWRYVDPTKIRKAQVNLASLRFWHLPSTHELHVQIQAVNDAVAKNPVRIQLKDAAGKIVFSADAKFSPELQRFIIPELDGGDYAVNLKIGNEEGDPQTLRRQKFSWENNRLGITDEVFAPFTKVKTAGDIVSVVLRDYRMNQFGLWDSVVAKGKELLSGPMRIVAVDENGKELDWKGKVTMVSDKPNFAVYKAASTCAAVGIEAVSEMEMDGMMKVSLTLNPVEKPVALKRMFIEIPIRDDVAPLLHEATDLIRSAYAGAMPAGEGEIWNSKKSVRQPSWINAFTSYIWMGGPERGLAWFAENDKGWITAKNYDAPLMRITREKGRVMLRIDLVNVQGVITKPTTLVFGIQASPTKPIPSDYRSKALTLGGVGLPVHPWGGLSCSWKSPWMEKWEVVDKVIEGRSGSKVDRAWFEKFEKDFDVPKVHGVQSWVDDVCRFASRATPLTNPDPIYFEEMAVLPFIPEYHVFQDEWSRERLADRSTASVDIYRNSGGREVNPGASANYSRSYQDYSLSLMNEWMKRGVSIYWDNTYLKNASNPLTSSAYVCSDGRVQPATIIWNEREYMKRTWNLMNEWRRKGVPRPLEFIAHMTNENLLPLFSWSTCNYDIEMSQSVYAKTFPESYEPGEPYTPEFLLTESTGLQVGAYPYIVHALFIGQCKLPAEALGPAPAQIESGRREWGMRMVHEIISGGPQHYELPVAIFNKAVYEFGYGNKDVDVWNYWADNPAFKIDNKLVKGILLTRKSDRKMLLVLQSWSKTAVKATVEFKSGIIGFDPGRNVYNAFSGEYSAGDGKTLKADLSFPYETGIYIIESAPQPEKILFADNFDAGLNPGWDSVSQYLKVKDGVLHFAENRASWQGLPRIFKWLNLPDFSDGELSFTFHIENKPETAAEILSVRFPADGVEWSKHGLTHSYVKGGIELQANADPKRGFVWRATGERDGKRITLGEGVSGAVNSDRHQVKIRLDEAGRYVVVIDGQPVIDCVQTIAKGGNAFGITARIKDVPAFSALDIDDVVLRAEKSTRKRLDAERLRALAVASEIVKNDRNELKNETIRVFGSREGGTVYNLALYRNPEQDLVEIGVMLKNADSPKRGVLLKFIKELPAREKEHVDSMTKIGQPADRLPQFKKARQEAMRILGELQSGTDTQAGAAIADALAAVKE
ncbi:MAG: glycoside hydrolase domain-containing protein, partial [Victivallales bacterium]